MSRMNVTDEFANILLFFCFFHFYLLVLIRHKKLGIKNFINKEHIERVCV